MDSAYRVGGPASKTEVITTQGENRFTRLALGFGVEYKT